MKGKIKDKILKLRDLSEYTAKVIEDAEAELLQVFNEKTHDMTRFDTSFDHVMYNCYLSLFVNENDDLKKAEESPVNCTIDLEELIIENNKRLITTNNR